MSPQRCRSVRHLALVGCTASGKSDVALELASELGDVEIVAVDSMQVYRGMDIGTAKATPQQRAAAIHHMIDLADPDEEWGVVPWVVSARQVLEEIESRGHRALLVGGTGLYLRALVDGFEPPGRFPDVAASIASEPDTSSLYRRLSELDPIGAARIESGNRRRIVRALEVCVGAGRPFSSFGPGMGSYPSTSWRVAGLWLPRRVVAERIARRFSAMLDNGLVAEVAALTKRPGGIGRSASQALGYREIVDHLAGEGTLDAAVGEAVRRTRLFARRQRVWWRRDPRIQWFGSAQNPLAVTPALLGHWEQP